MGIRFTPSPRHGPLSHFVDGSATTQQKVRNLICDLTDRLQADAAVLLLREGDQWQVMATAGEKARSIPTGSTFPANKNPILSADYHPEQEEIPAEPAPFAQSLGSVALGEAICCPVVTDNKLAGTLNLYMDSDRDFDPAAAEAVAYCAELLAALLGNPDGAIRQEPPDTAKTGAVEEAVALGELPLLLSLLNHDMRSPINAMLGFSELLMSPDCDASDVARYAQMIATGGHALTDTLDRLIRLMRIVIGQTGWQPVHTQVADMFSGIALEGAPDGDAHWDVTAVCDAINSLSAHTKTATGDGQVLVMSSPTHVHLTIGAPSAEEHLLDPAYRSAQVQFARQVIMAHDGVIRTDTSGTWFSVLLPRYPETFPGSAAGSPEPAS